MNFASWYYAENEAKHVHQVVIKIPQGSEVPPPFGNLIADAGFMQVNWGATVLFPRGSSLPVIFIKATGAIDMLRGNSTEVAFAFYRFSKGSLFQIFIRVDSKQIKEKFGYPFFAEHSRWPDEQMGRQIVDALVSTEKLQLCFAAPGQKGPCTGFFGLEAAVPSDCLSLLQQEWNTLQKHHAGTQSPDFQACLDQYNKENPIEESPILLRPDSGKKAETSVDNESRELGELFVALKDAKDGDILEKRGDGTWKKAEGGYGLTEGDIIELSNNGIFKVGEIDITPGMYEMARTALEMGSGSRKITAFAQDLIREKKERDKAKARTRPKKISIFLAFIVAAIGVYNLLNPADLGTPFWIHLLTAAATFGISFLGTAPQLKRFDIAAGIFYILLSAATFFSPAQLEIADFVLHLLIGPAYLIAAFSGLSEDEKQKEGVAERNKEKVQREICEICTSTDKVERLNHSEMRKAALKGFDPFLLGIVNAGKRDMNWHLVPVYNRSPWLLCSNCLEKLNYFKVDDHAAQRQLWMDAAAKSAEADRLPSNSPIPKYRLGVALSKNVPENASQEEVDRHKTDVCHRLEEALKLDETKKELLPQDYREIAFICGAFYRSLKRPEDALRLFKLGLKRMHADPELLAGRAWCEFELGQQDQAEKTVARVLSLKSDSEMGRALYKAIYELKGGKDMVEPKVIGESKVVQKGTESLEGFEAKRPYWRGTKFAKQGDWKQAAQSFREAVRLQPDSSLFHYAFANAKLKAAPQNSTEEELKKYRLDVCRIFEKAMGLDQTSNELQAEDVRQLGLSAGALYRSLQKHDDALRVFQWALKRNPQDEELLDGCGWSEFDLGRMDEAEHTVARLLKLHPQSEDGRKLWKSIRSAQGKESTTDEPVAPSPRQISTQQATAATNEQVKERKLELGKGTTVLQFPPGWEGQYENHLKLIVHLQALAVYPRLKVFGMKANVPQAGSSRLIILTGPISELEQIDKVYYKTEAEDFVARELNNNWDAINPKSSVSNVPKPGYGLDLSRFEAEILSVRRDYELERVLDSESGAACSSPVTEKDLASIRAYWRHLGKEWWKSQDSSQQEAICDSCNEYISRDKGVLSGSYLLCEKCCLQKLDALDQLRQNPNYFGAGVLEKARAFVSRPEGAR